MLIIQNDNFLQIWTSSIRFSPFFNIVQCHIISLPKFAGKLGAKTLSSFCWIWKKIKETFGMITTLVASTVKLFTAVINCDS